MKQPHSSKLLFILTFLVSMVFLSSCSTSRTLTPRDLDKGRAIKVFLNDGSVHEGMLLEAPGNELVMVSEVDHQVHKFSFKDIRRIERSSKYYDYMAYPISEAEIEKYRTDRNAWGYALGGAVVGGLAGLVVGYPLWDYIPPYFTAGVAAVVGTITFGVKGIQKDKNLALEKVQFLRQRERELERQKAEELRKLEELRKQKEELLKKLKKKKEQDKLNTKK